MADQPFEPDPEQEPGWHEPENDTATADTIRLTDEDEWLPDRMVESLAMERAVNPSETEEELSRRLLRESSAVAVTSVVHLAKHGGTERVRLDASKYIIDRVLGRIGESFDDGKGSPWENLVKQLEAEAAKDQDRAPDYFRGAGTTPTTNDTDGSES